MEKLKIEHRLPLIDIAIPALKQLSLNQYKIFRANLVALIKMDDKVDLMEWSLQKILFNHLDGQFFKLTRTKARYSKLKQLKKETVLVLSVLAHAGNKNENEAKGAFNAAAKTLDFTGLELLARKEISLAVMDRALKKLAMLKPLVKPQFLKACVASIGHDQIISPVEVELFRAFSDVLDCPMPPIKL